MEIAIGFRVSPTEVYYSIVQEENGEQKFGGPFKLLVPKMLENGPCFKYIRTNLLDITKLYKANRACVKLAEHSGFKQKPQRVYIEGVVQEMLASSHVEVYLIGASPQLGPLLGMASGDFIGCVKGVSNPMNVEGWKDMKNEARESVLAALAVLRKEKT